MVLYPRMGNAGMMSTEKKPTNLNNEAKWNQPPL